MAAAIATNSALTMVCHGGRQRGCEAGRRGQFSTRPCSTHAQGGGRTQGKKEKGFTAEDQQDNLTPELLAHLHKEAGASRIGNAGVPRTNGTKMRRILAVNGFDCRQQGRPLKGGVSVRGIRHA
eukprot:208586-Pelagomonas_calceolata.AAC.1